MTITKFSDNGDVVQTAFTPSSIIHHLEQSGALTPTGLTLPDDIDFATYEAVGVWIAAVDRGVKWWWGDWLNHGERCVEHYEQAVATTRKEHETIRVWAWVAEKVPQPIRKPALSWSVHKEVARLDPEVQEELLQRAVEESWGTFQVRQAKKERESPTAETSLDIEQPEPPDTLEAAASAVLFAASFHAETDCWRVPAPHMARLRAVLEQEER